MKILICGDSFAADWTVKYPGKGWPNLLAEMHQVTNLAQAGCSEYKILKQLESVNVNAYDKIIISHTSPYRIFVEKHPVHFNDPLHKNCDLIYTDLKAHLSTDKDLVPIIDYFEKYFDFEHAKFMHTLLCEKVEKHVAHLNGRVLHITNLDWNGLHKFNNMISFEYLFKTNRGLLNHFDEIGNQKIFHQLLKLLQCGSLAKIQPPLLSELCTKVSA